MVLDIVVIALCKTVAALEVKRAVTLCLVAFGGIFTITGIESTVMYPAELYGGCYPFL